MAEQADYRNLSRFYLFKRNIPSIGKDMFQQHSAIKFIHSSLNFNVSIL